jgi:hypothetical protein
VRVLNDPSNGTATIVVRKLRSQGLDLNDNMVRKSLWRQGLHARVKTKKPLLTKKHQARRYFMGKEV